MKKATKILSLIVGAISFLAVPFSGCKKEEKDGGVSIKPSGEAYVSNFEYLYGICETPVDLYPEVDAGLTTDWIAHVCKSMGIKSYRIWAHIEHLFTVSADDSITMNQDYANRIKNFVATLEAAGVEKFSLLTADRLHLAEDKKYLNSTVPDPTTDYDKYVRALELESKAYEMMAREFSGIDYFEIINEPDHAAGVGINKNGYVLDFNSTGGGEYNFTTEETAMVCMDFNWYVRRGLKKGNPNAKLMMPALCHYASSVAFLEEMYKAIYSKKLPAGQEFSDTDPDNYFDVLNWHPYVNTAFGLNESVDELWVARQNEFHDVAVKYGDAEKPVWLTEFGFTDGGDSYILGDVADDGTITGLAPENFILALEAIKKELPWVETLCMFRMTDMYNVQYDVQTENTFGMFYNPDDPENLGKPKPSAVAVTRYIKGGTLTYDDMKELCKYYYDVHGDIPDEYKAVVTTDVA